MFMLLAIVLAKLAEGAGFVDKTTDERGEVMINNDTKPPKNDHGEKNIEKARYFKSPQGDYGSVCF